MDQQKLERLRKDDLSVQESSGTDFAIDMIRGQIDGALDKEGLRLVNDKDALREENTKKISSLTEYTARLLVERANKEKWEVLRLDGLTRLESEVAAELAKFEGGEINLWGLENSRSNLSEVFNQLWVDFRGKIHSRFSGSA